MTLTEADAPEIEEESATESVRPRSSRPPKPPKPPRQPKVPKPPRRPPTAPIVRGPLTPMQAFARSASAMLAAMLFMFFLNLVVLSHVQHLASQQQLSNTFRAELAAGTAPVSEGDFDDVLLADGAPVALLEIPSIGVREVIVEGTSSAELAMGPGHRRDTVLPGQAGVSVIMGRNAAFGGPFSAIQRLAPGESFTVRTGQGEHVFEVIGLRYAGDPQPPSPRAGEGRLLLQTARGGPYVPTGIAYVDARQVSDVQPAGARQTTRVTLPPEQKALATDTTTVWALVFALQFLIVIEIAAVWAFRRIGAQKTWIVFVPVVILSGVVVSDQLIRLLPNLL
ncbi:sortase [Agromyces atrinae]|uniref:sortase n=1 Tax=Agromyces atrinae TaxID=592376 RepID=UPI001F56630D|nr:sortase [Agromyces atrinae]MCI2956330.1 sortase [Agromyces atrinae]